jgi:site-specific DNA-cytosine methylase
MTSIAKQIGNAVPPLLAQHIAESLLAQLNAAGAADSDRSTELIAA